MFSPVEHAYLFACLARAAIRLAGEAAGSAAVRRGVRLYGEQRGRRMALRVQADGRPLSMLNFLIYSEWQTAPGENESVMVEFVPDARSSVRRCVWNSTWRENDLLPYGRLYCLEIDSALLRGYNPDLRLSVNQTLSNQGEPCDFIYAGAELTQENLERLQYGKRSDPGPRARMPWEYHTGHLYQTLRGVFITDLPDADRAALSALDAFSERFGQPAAEVVRSYAAVNFDQITFGVNTKL
jgi:hypothetical protein